MNLPKHACGLYLTHNEHRDYYETVEQWEGHAEHPDKGWKDFGWISEEERAKAIATDEVWSLQWYPRTPIGFEKVIGSSLEAVLAAAAALEANHGR